MKLLISIPDSPFDPTAGAPRSMRTIGELMAAAGHEVRCIGTTVTGHDLPNLRRPEGNFRKVNYSLVDVDGAPPHAWRTPDNERTLDEWFHIALGAWKPDILLCYGGHGTDVARFLRAKARGVKVVFGLRNYGYKRPGFLAFCDGVITPSRFLSNWYRTQCGLESTPLPSPIWLEDVVAEKGDPIYFTAINPTLCKGAMLLLTVFRTLAQTRPDIPLLVVGEEENSIFHQVLGNTANALNFAPWQANPKDIYAQTKVLLVPSVWEEPAGRVIAEAMLNGIPPIITDRGGMVETANGGAYVLPLDPSITEARKEPVPIEVAQPWINAILDLNDCEDFDLISQRAKTAAAIYKPENTTPLYEAYFEAILAGKKPDTLEAPATQRAAAAESSRTEQPR